MDEILAVKGTDSANIPSNFFILKMFSVVLTAYVNYFNATNPDEKREYLRQHLKSVNDHIERLADKTYQSIAGLNTLDYVFMFMPVEPALTLAVNLNSEILIMH